MSDLIDRQAAIDALDEQIEQCNKSLSSFDISMRDGFAVKVERTSLVAFRETLEYLPPAQLSTNLAEVGTDTISRQAAIEAVAEAMRGLPVVCIDIAEEAIKQLPPAQPTPSQVTKDIARIVENGQDMRVIGQERIRGHWIIRETSSGDTEARCSHCGFTTLVDEPGNGLHMVSDLNFCPNCGADMREVTT